jgi:RNA polymerase sigma-70 factor (ECF subfamily)
MNILMLATQALPIQHLSGASQVTDQARLEAMYRAHHVVIWRTLRRLGFSPEAAADSTHQAYLIAAERLDQIHFGSEKAFLFSTAIRLAKTVARKNRRMDLHEDIETGPDPNTGGDKIVNRQVALQLLERLFSHMDPDLVTVFTLYELEGMSSPEIAGILDIPLGTVASRLRRARETFRKGAAQLERSGVRPNHGSTPMPTSTRGANAQQTDPEAQGKGVDDHD